MQWGLALLVSILTGWILYQSANLSGKGLILLFPFCLTVYMFFATAITTTTIDKQKKILTVKKIGLLKNSFSSYQFSEIDGFPYVEVTYSRGTYYSIQLPLKIGKNIELAARRSLNKRTYYKAVDRANKYLLNGSDKDFKLTILDDD